MTCLHRTLAIIDQISSFRENSLNSSGQIPHNSSPLQPLQSLQWGGLLNKRIVVIWPLSLLVHKFGRLMQVSNMTLMSHPYTHLQMSSSEILEQHLIPRVGGWWSLHKKFVARKTPFQGTLNRKSQKTSIRPQSLMVSVRVMSCELQWGRG